MSVNLKTNRMVWGRAASRCSLSDCRRELVIDSLDTDDPSLVGEVAHIVAEQPDGPRGCSELSSDQRNKYANLMLLCNVHHKQIDDHEIHFTVERLSAIKAAHENWVKTCLSSFDHKRQKDDEQWAGYIEDWTCKLGLDYWQERVSGFFQAQPVIDRSTYERLETSKQWLFSRVWPKSNPLLRFALENFTFVVNDLLSVFMEHAEEVGSHKNLRTEKFYKINEYNEARYFHLLKKYEVHVDLVTDLASEMTRAANLVCDRVRENLDSSFRLEQGVLLVTSGMDIAFMEHTYRLEYGDEARSRAHSYQGLDEFRKISRR